MNTLEQDAARFETLPSDFQEALRNFDYDKRLQAIHQKFRLHIDQSFALEKTVADAIFGALHSNQILNRIKESLHTTKEQADEIGEAINSEILIPIRHAIQKIEEDRDQD